MDNNKALVFIGYLVLIVYLLFSFMLMFVSMIAGMSLLIPPLCFGFVYCQEKSRQRKKEFEQYVESNKDLQSLGGMKLLEEICEGTGLDEDEAKHIAASYAHNSKSHRFDEFDEHHAFWRKRYV